MLICIDIDKIFLKDGEVYSESSSTVAGEHSPERKEAQESEKTARGNNHVEEV
jgi:hypothetical protein